MSAADEQSAVALARRAGEQLDSDHSLLVGGSKSLAGALGRMLEQRVFDREYGGHSPEVMQAEYGPYDDRSLHVVILDGDGPVAAGRVIWASATDLTKLETDLGLVHGELRSHHRCVERFGTSLQFEHATVVVEKRAFSRVTGWLLGELRYQQMCIDEHAPSCAMVDVRFARMLRSWGTEVERACGLEPFEYLEQTCEPIFFVPGYETRLSSSRLYRLLSIAWEERVARPLVSTSVVDITESAEAETLAI